MRGERRLPLVGGALLLSIILQWGCAPYRAETRPTAQTRSPAPAGDAQRSDRGNPPFYDVLGKRYHVLESSDGYRQRGIASWYGRDFHGLTTSSGEPYNMHAMTAAHTTLPLPTWVEVTNLGNGKRVIVKVNDRGPFVDERLIDLSYAAAVELDMVRVGTARVEVRALGASQGPVPVAAPPPPAAATVAAEPVRAGGPSMIAPAASGSQQMFVQVGAFAERDNAARLVARLKANGFANSFVVSDREGRRAMHRVRLGPLADSKEFDHVRGRLRMLGVGESHLVVDRCSAQC